MIKSYKVRIYPTTIQEQLMWKHIGCCRYIWNYMLALQMKRYESGEKHLSAFDTIKLLTPLKKEEEYMWLKEVSNTSLQLICQDLEKAYQGLFAKRAKLPKFKSRKKSKPNFPTRSDAMYFKDKSIVSVEKIGKVRYKTDFEFPIGKGYKFSNARISYVNGKWMLSFGMESENQAPVLTDKSMGIDLGVKTTAVVAFGGEKFEFHNINKSKKMRFYKKKLTHLQRSISRKYEAIKTKAGRYEKSNNIIKQENQLRKLHVRIANIRQNYIHQTTHTLIAMLPKQVVMEDLNVSGMMKNRHLSKAIGEQCFGEFIRQMKYKCEWNGIEFTQVGRFYPSSKTCSSCGHVKSDLKLNDRLFVCNECGQEIDRDYNAAVNLMRYSA